jgi:hypothetical protein
MGDRELRLRTTVTANSLQRLFGPPGAVDYRQHPGQAQPESPVSIFSDMRAKEVAPLNDINKLKGSVYSFKNRKIIARWLRDVCSAFGLRSTSFALAIQLTDAFLISNLNAITVSQCQLAAITALWIAAKFEEMDEQVPQLRAVVDVCDGAYTAADVIDMEERILEGFSWRLPHTTVTNYVYLYLHMHSLIPPIERTVFAALGAHEAPVYVVVVEPTTKLRRYIAVNIPLEKPFQDSIPELCAAASIKATSNVELFKLVGDDFLLATRLSLSQAPRDLRESSKPLALYVAGSGSGVAVSGASIFAENNRVVILKSVNALVIHACETLCAELLVHVEFLRLPSHVLAVGIVALARCIVGRNAEETKAAIAFLLKELSISGTQSLASADLLCDKYREALANPEGFPPPVVELPVDIRDRIKYVFSK